MERLLNETIESRRNDLINKLIENGQYKKDGKHLFELSLLDLENEYYKITSKNHPHSGIDSIRWINFK